MAWGNALKETFCLLKYLFSVNYLYGNPGRICLLVLVILSLRTERVRNLKSINDEASILPNPSFFRFAFCVFEINFLGLRTEVMEVLILQQLK